MGYSKAEAFMKSNLNTVRFYSDSKMWLFKKHINIHIYFGKEKEVDMKMPM